MHTDRIQFTMNDRTYRVTLHNYKPTSVRLRVRQPYGFGWRRLPSMPAKVTNAAMQQAAAVAVAEFLTGFAA